MLLCTTSVNVVLLAAGYNPVLTKYVFDCFRPQATQSFIGQYATQVVTFPRLDHPAQRPLSSGNDF